MAKKKKTDKKKETAAESPAPQPSPVPGGGGWSPASFRFVTGPIRPEAQQVHVYNEGYVVFLYDVTRAGRIEQANPEILEGYGDETLEDPALVPLFAERTLILAMLEGDGGVDIEVVVGPELTAEELAEGSWLEPQQAALSLPSGNLQIHTYNSLPIADGDEDGGAAQVPPGEYRVTLYRKDWATEEAEGRDWLEVASAAGIEVYDEGRIDDVLVLTPLEAPEGEGGVLFAYD